MDHEQVNRWLAAYVAAWKSYDRAAIGALFSEDARCWYHPYDEPVVGREAIVESWFGDRQDPSGTYDGIYQCLVVEGDAAVTHRAAVSTSSPTDPLTRSTTTSSC